MAQPTFGVSENEDLKPHLINRETRPLLYRINDVIADAGGFIMMMIGIMTIVLSWMPIPKVSDFVAAFGFLFVWYARKKYRKFTFRTPHVQRKGVYTPSDDDGLFLLGNTTDTGAAAWFSNGDMRSHMLVFGTTGSGKTVFLLGLFYQALLVGSGVMFVDGKADNTIYWMVYALCRRLGREDDLLLINYLTGGAAADRYSKSLERLSNTTNPFAYGSSEQLRSLVVGLMRESGGDGDMWKGRASSMLGSLLKALCYMRDREEIILDVMKISEYLPLDKISNLAQQDFPDHIIAPIRKYLVTLPGYTEEDAIIGNIHEKAYEQHGYLTMQLTEVLGDLSDTYGHIFADPLGEVDFKDVVFNRRILFVMLPSLEADPDRLAGLGKLVVAGIRSALAPALGNTVEGMRTEVIERKPTNAKVPFLLILDEYGYYSVKGFAVVAAQARSLGVACIFAGQDYPSFKKGDENEAASTVANTNIKVILKLEDADETFKLVEGRGGESDVAVVHGHDRNNSGNGSYIDQGTTRIDRRKRINLRDLVSQRAGDGHIIFGDTVLRCQLFYVAPEDISMKLQEARLNKFIQVPRPTAEKVAQLKGAYDRLVKLESGKVTPITAARTGKRRLMSGGKAGDPNISTLIRDYAMARTQRQGRSESAMLAIGMQELRARLIDMKIEEVAQEISTPKAPSTAQPLPATVVVAPAAQHAQVEAASKGPSWSQDQTNGEIDDHLLDEAFLDVDEEPQIDDSIYDDVDDLPEHSASLVILDQDSPPVQTSRDSAERIEFDFASTLSAVILERAQKLANRPLSPAERDAIAPAGQLTALEVKGGLDAASAQQEANRAIEMLSEKIKYPTDPMPIRRDKQSLEGHLGQMLKSLTEAARSDSDD